MVSKIIIVGFFSILILEETGKIIYLLFKPKFLDRPLFRPPTRKLHIITYYCAAIFVMLLVILNKLGVISAE